MRYYIGLVPQEEIAQVYDSALDGILKEFDLEKLKNGQRRAPHITLKSPYDAESVLRTRQLVSDFARSERERFGGSKSYTYVIEGVGMFKENEQQVLYLKVTPSPGMLDSDQRLLARLGRDGSIPFSQYDTPNKTLHVTLLRGAELEDKGEEIFRHMGRFDWSRTPVGKMDKITIFRKEMAGTLVDMSYPLRDLRG